MSNDDPQPSEPASEPAASAAPPDPVEEIERQRKAGDELKDRLLRVAADFENFKKRAKKEVDEATQRGRDALTKELLPVLDNLSRALAHASADDALAKGVQMVEKQLLGVLERLGITRFSAIGEMFDPNQHDAIQQVETSEHAPGTVAVEFAAGYLSNGRLLRAAMVGVAKAPSGSAGS